MNMMIYAQSYVRTLLVACAVTLFYVFLYDDDVSAYECRMRCRNIPCALPTATMGPCSLHARALT